MWITSVICLALVVVIGAHRWRLIVSTGLDKKMKYLEALKFTWIGLLFNSILPGAVSGDFIKLIYVKKRNRSTPKTFLLISIFMDRIFGLMSLFFLLGFFSIINYSEIISTSKQVEAIIKFNFLLFIGATCFIVFLFLKRSYQEFLLKYLQKIPLLGNQIYKTLDQTWSVGENKMIVIKCLAYSFLCQTLNIFAFWFLISPFTAGKLPIDHAFTFIPIGLITTAIPITPAGIGLGHAAFDTLFNYFSINQGASLFNVYFVFLLFVNFLGLIPYLMNHEKIQTKELNQFQESID